MVKVLYLNTHVVLSQHLTSGTFLERNVMLSCCLSLADWPDLRFVIYSVIEILVVRKKSFVFCWL